MIKDCGGIKLINGHYVSDASDLLAQAADQGFETVIVLGFKNGSIHIQRSAMVSRISLLGAIEEAKHHVLENP